ncbi:hypothetical protein [Pseudaestuariivita atlantica]|uniref:Uncharacterized protein n=1 Tax=Pseudaestuariivita atlantica TaxID=1317121 RepID=A0A0L1JTY9_9RHOB|nr:hypothetical protein [Pseudaestuariivita atlantica]KNG95226.1 hypothetical protein ATO11_00870 [Pseudaestuariivita atlantica]
MTLTAKDIDTLASRATKDPAAEAALIWPFAWGLASVALIWAFGDFAFWRTDAGVNVSLDAVGLGLVLGGVLAAGVMWVYFRWRRQSVAAAKRTLRSLAEQVRAQEVSR